MHRSIKKGPYCEERLVKRVNAMRESGKKSIIKNGGVLENIVMEDNKPMERYWIEIK